MDATVHLVDDDADFREGLAWLLDSRQVHTTAWANGAAFLEGVAALRDDWPPAAVLLDIRMEPVSGLTVFERLREWHCPWPVLFLTGHGDIGMAVRAVKQGAWDFLEKPFQDNTLVDKVLAALEVARSAPHREAQRLRQGLQSLSPREHEVLRELLSGRYNKNIAERLGITERTVEFHRGNIFQKMGVSSAVELAHRLGRHGLL